MERRQFGPFDLDALNRRLLRHGQEVPLAPKTLDLLIALVARNGDLVTKEELMQLLWPDTFVDEANLTQQIFVLRKALGQRRDEQTYIATVPRAGYRFVTPAVAPVPDAPLAAPGRATRTTLLTLMVVVVITALIMFWWWPFAGPGPLKGRTMSRITGTSDAGAAAISPDGRFVAYVQMKEGRSSIWLHQVSTGQSTRLIDDVPASISAVTFSGDGEWVSFLRDHNGGEWATVPVVGGEARTVLTRVESVPAVSPDATRLALIRTDQAAHVMRLEVVDLATLASTTLLRRERPEVILTSAGVAWSPDGQSVAVITNEAFGGRSARLVIVDVASQKTETLATALPWNSGKLVWLPDDSGFLVSARRLHFVDRRSGTVTPITHDAADYPSVSVSAAGPVVARRQEEQSAVWRLPEQAAQPTPWFSEYGFNHALAWLPDERVAFESWASGDPEIWVTSRDPRRGPQRLSFDDGYDAFPSAAPDGLSIVYASGREGGSTLWRAPLDGAPPVRVGGAGVKYAPDVSPDGRWIVYHAGDAQQGWKLSRVSHDGAVEAPVGDRPGTFAVYSPDGQWIACNWLPEGRPPGWWFIAILPADGGPPARVLPIPGGATRRLAWSRDGTRLYWTNVWDAIREVNIETGLSRTVVTHPGERILTVSVSRQTGEMAYVRHTSRSDIVIWK